MILGTLLPEQILAYASRKKTEITQLQTHILTTFLEHQTMMERQNKERKS